MPKKDSSRQKRSKPVESDQETNGVISRNSKLSTVNSRNQVIEEYGNEVDKFFRDKEQDLEEIDSDDADFYENQRKQDIMAGIDSEEEIDLEKYGIRGLKTKKFDSDDETSDKEPTVTWGQKKGRFYDAEQSSDEEIRKEEEEEALRLRRIQLEQMSEQDFFDDFVRPQTRQETVMELQDTTPMESSKEFTSSLPILLEYAWNHYNTEVKPLITFCKQVLDVKPKGKRRQRHGPRLELQERQAFQYLLLKEKILLTYMTNLSFAIMIQDEFHPVVETISKLRSHLRLCAHMEDGAFSIVSGQDLEEMKAQDVSHWDPLSWEKLSESLQETEQELLLTTLFQNSVCDGVERLAAWYRNFVETGEVERPAYLDYEQEEDFESLLNKSEEEVGEEFMEEEAEEALEGLSDDMEQDLSDDMQQDLSDMDFPQTQSEDDTFRPLTRNVKPSKPKKHNDLDDDISRDKILSKVEGLEKKEKKASSRFVVGRVMQNLTTTTSKFIKHGMGDVDVPYKTLEKERQAQASVMGVDDAIRKRNEEEESNLQFLKKQRSKPSKPTKQQDDALDFYEKHVQEAETKKLEKKERIQSKALNTLGDWDDEYDSGKRGASKQILKNRGLAPRTKKVNRNPRVKKRVKYAKAVKKMESSVRKSYKPGQAGHYGGETTGIKTNVSKSVKYSNK